MDDIEVRELRYFVAVAEELNFSRAAERLRMAQPPLSRAIRQLEHRLGVRLFERDTRRVTLTAAGRTLLEEARAALDVVSAAARRTRRAGSAAPTMVVTAKPGLASGLLQRIAEAYRALPDLPRVEVVVSGYRRQADMVRDGRVDVALLSWPFDGSGLEWEPLVTEPRVAAIPAGHPLARRSVLRCGDLVGQPMPNWAGSTPEERAYWSGRDRDLPGHPAGRDPLDSAPDGPVVNDSTELLEVVGLGQAVALVPLSLAEGNPRPDVAYRPVEDASPYTVAVAWREGARARSIASFVRTAIELAASEPHAARQPVGGSGSRKVATLGR
jgi:DNA-binding transcriptional LysR family regulator